MSKRIKIEFATIRVAGYINGKQSSNALTYKLMGFDETDFAGLVEKERRRIETFVQSELVNSEAKAKVTKMEKRYIDGVVRSEQTNQ
ncbi:MAG: hypothetical protein IJL57_07650 [Bacteroidales bacterium]|nr:hypothetical protein [Bacteroidales bacterium]MBQ5994181.1 hypothetical protein [Bacteroidales bacterium]